MGFIKKLKRNNKKQQKETEKKVQEFKEEIRQVCEKFGMNIRPIITKFGVEFEIVIVDNKDSNKELSVEPPKKNEEIPEGHSEELSKKI